MLELGDGVAGAAAADVLAGLGASVTTMVAADSVLRALDPQVCRVSLLSAVLDSRRPSADGVYFSSSQVCAYRVGAAPF